MLIILFHLNVKDTQTGLKVFKAEAIKPVGHLIRTSGFAYDIELLVAVHRRGFKIAEMPVEVVFVRDKGVNRIGIKDHSLIPGQYLQECILSIIMINSQYNITINKFRHLCVNWWT